MAFKYFREPFQNQLQIVTKFVPDLPPMQGQNCAHFDPF